MKCTYYVQCTLAVRRTDDINGADVMTTFQNFNIQLPNHDLLNTTEIKKKIKSKILLRFDCFKTEFVLFIQNIRLTLCYFEYQYTTANSFT
jgi:hypothetical protein